MRRAIFVAVAAAWEFPRSSEGVPVSEPQGQQCSFHIPAAITCAYEGRWAPLRAAAQANAAAGFKPDMELLQLAHDLIMQFEATEYPPHGFLNLLCRYSPDAGSDGFCLYGFVTALYIRARHLMESDDPDMRKMAQNDLQYASVCLGKELSV